MPTPPRILIVDDDWLTRVEVEEMVTSLGYEVVGKAENGKKAIEMARDLRPDLIIMDVVIPGGVNGIEAARQIKTEQDVPIVFISGYGDEAYIQGAKELSPFGYVMKPFDEREVRAFVEIALHNNRMEVQLREANQRLSELSREWEGIFQAVGEPALILDPEHYILNANRAACDAVGQTETALRTKPCYEIFHCSDAPPANCPFEKMRQSRQMETAEMKMESLGNRWFLISSTPMLDEQGRVEKAIHMAVDITEKKIADKARREITKMKAVSTLAGGIAHQFNNALTTVSWAASLLEMQCPENDHTLKYFTTIERSIQKMTFLTGQLLAYARGGKYNVREISIVRIIRDTLPLLKPSVDNGIQLMTDLAVDIAPVKGDFDQLQHVLSALVANANEAMNDHGCIQISARNMKLDEGFIATRPGLLPGPHVCLSVSDDGEGMDEETRKRIFEPFFTTHFLGRGLGMAAVYGIVKNHDGWIDVESQPGKGAQVHIYFPAAGI